jgi:hypothetical protein
MDAPDLEAAVLGMLGEDDEDWITACRAVWRAQGIKAVAVWTGRGWHAVWEEDDAAAVAPAAGED